MLTQEQKQQREGKLTASRVGILMNGTEQQIYDLYRELTGDPTYVEENLDDVWAVQLGSHTEKLNIDWYARKRSVSLRGVVVVHFTCDWAACTLDAWDDELSCPIEAKHVNGFSSFDDVVQRYLPQLHWQMYCTDSDRAIISVIIGANEPKIQTILRDDNYMNNLVSRAKSFMDCVNSLMPPVNLPPVKQPIPLSAMIKVDMEGNNSWADSALTWLETKDAAKKFKDSADALKALVPENASTAFGHGITISRFKNNSLTIKETK
jgi:YqaJ-like viral recombinase domain